MLIILKKGRTIMRRIPKYTVSLVHIKGSNQAKTSPVKILLVLTRKKIHPVILIVKSMNKK